MPKDDFSGLEEGHKLYVRGGGYEGAMYVGRVVKYQRRGEHIVVEFASIKQTFRLDGRQTGSHGYHPARLYHDTPTNEETYRKDRAVRTVERFYRVFTPRKDATLHELETAAGWAKVFMQAAKACEEAP